MAGSITLRQQIENVGDLFVASGRAFFTIRFVANELLIIGPGVFASARA